VAPGSIIAAIIVTHTMQRTKANEPSLVATPMFMPRIWSMATTQHAAAAARVAVSTATVVAVPPPGTAPDSWCRKRVIAMIVTSYPISSVGTQLRASQRRSACWSTVEASRGASPATVPGVRTRCAGIGQCGCVPNSYEWRGAFASAKVEALHAEGFDHGHAPGPDWEAQLERHSLGWACAREDGELVGFANVAW
jgi:hypothetical protein